jgi:hypothetical protein
MKYMIAPMMAANPVTPPTTPPAIVAVFEVEEEEVEEGCAGCGWDVDAGFEETLVVASLPAVVVCAAPAFEAAGVEFPSTVDAPPAPTTPAVEAAGFGVVDGVTLLPTATAQISAVISFVAGQYPVNLILWTHPIRPGGIRVFVLWISASVQLRLRHAIAAFSIFVVAGPHWHT